MISIFYTGDRRHNPEIMRVNHDAMIQRLALIDTVEVSWFTKDFADRGECPFDEGGDDVSLRRGQGGAVQVWDFIKGAERLDGDVVIKFRTDLWFTASAREVIAEHVERITKGEVDVVYFGSDLVNGNQGKEHGVYDITAKEPARIQDFVIAAKKQSLAPAQRVIDRMLMMPPRKIRSGNKVFRYILGDGCRARGVICHLWLIRKFYDTVPTDRDVCRDYIASYMERTRPEVNELLDPAWEWWITYQ
jgi:hypothetical protein